MVSSNCSNMTLIAMLGFGLTSTPDEDNALSHPPPDTAPSWRSARFFLPSIGFVLVTKPSSSQGTEQQFPSL